MLQAVFSTVWLKTKQTPFSPEILSHYWYDSIYLLWLKTCEILELCRKDCTPSGVTTSSVKFQANILSQMNHWIKKQ